MSEFESGILNLCAVLSLRSSIPERVVIVSILCLLLLRLSVRLCVPFISAGGCSAAPVTTMQLVGPATHLEDFEDIKVALDQGLFLTQLCSLAD